MAIRVAIYGFKHGHIQSVVRTVGKMPGVELAVLAEDDPHYRAVAEQALGLPIRDASGEQILEGEEFDVFATGDAYGRRGALLLKALDSGRHILGDKPLCTRLSECDAIAAKLAETGLAAGLLLTMRYRARFVELRRRLCDGWLGELRSLQAFGPHHLAWGSRPDWYFTPELHGGILNDLQCHGLDLMRWLSGRELERVLYAAVGNVAAPQAPRFEDIGQCLCLFEGGARFGGEVNYLAPAKGQAMGWVLLGWCSGGQFRTEDRGDVLAVDVAGRGPVELDAPPLAGPSPEHDFLTYLETGRTPLLTTEDVVRTSRSILQVQAAAERI
ncbi:MAG: Gfo/Idh/MocA family oxidoreductase [Armatimonadetes bacterium]|nr:Gfo/Idh/MocA family oxidoreductase [Armatimonadota bacterium]